MNTKNFIRICQECGYQRVSKRPDIYKDDPWKNIKCRQCESIGSFDFGTYMTFSEQQQIAQEWQS